MKIRIQGNTIRFRLKKFEVEALAEKKPVKEILCFGEAPGDQLQFVLQVINGEFALEQNVTVISLTIPESVAGEWAQTQRVGFEQKIRTAKGKEINILVEKDFKCLNRSDRDEAGSYPNPMKQC